MRIIDGPLAPFGDAVELAHRVKTEPRHAGLFDLFLEVRNAAAKILDHTSLGDVVSRNRRLLARRERPPRRGEERSQMSINPSVKKTCLRRHGSGPCVNAVRTLRYGSVEIVVHDGRVVQIETREKVRFADAGHRPPDDRGREPFHESRADRTTGAEASAKAEEAER